MKKNIQNLQDHKWILKIKSLFKQGLTPVELALSMSIGAVIGVIPLFGVTSFITAAIILRLRLNLPVALFMTYIMGPAHVLLFLPFIRFGEGLLGMEHVNFSVASFGEIFQSVNFSTLYHMLVSGLAGWMTLGIPAAMLLCLFLWSFFILYQRQREGMAMVRVLSRNP